MSDSPQSRVPFDAAERDPVSDPEPPVPPLPEPDPGVFHHEPGEPPAQPEVPQISAMQTPEKDPA